MNEIITSREELLWAKLAGRDADISTMTPPVYANLVEKFMAETAERIDNAGSGGGGDTYETVAEIAVGQMELVDGKYMYTVQTGTDLPDGDLYWESADQPLTKYTDDGDLWAFNYDAEFDLLGTPAYAITVFTEEEESATIVVSDTNAIENTTVKILKKASGGGAGLPEVTAEDEGKVLTVENGAWGKATTKSDVLVVTADVDFDRGTVSNPSKAAKSIYDANQAGKIVVGRFTHTKSGVELITDMLLQSCFESGVNLYTCVFSTSDEEYTYNVTIETLSYSCGKDPILPMVTSEDDGKFLGVVNGEWGKTDAPGAAITIEKSIEENSPNPVTGGAIFAALRNKASTDYVDEKVAEEIGDITTFAYYLCGSGEYDAQGVPTVQNPDTVHIYLTPTVGTNLNMYAFINNAFTFLGTTEMDLTGYVTEEELEDYVPENVSAFVNDAGYITNPRTVLWNYRPQESQELPVGNIGGAEHVYLHSAEASADTVAALQAAATQQIYLNRADQPLTADPDSEDGEVLLTYNLKATETGAELQVDVDDTSKPFYIVSLGADEEAASGYVFIVIAGTPPEEFDWKIFTEGAYLTEHQSLAAYPQRNELKPVATSGSYNDLSGVPINSSGATTRAIQLGKPLTVTGGDSANAGKITLDQAGNGQITDASTSTIFGFMVNNELTVGSSSYALKLRGNGTNPKYNGYDLALKSEIPPVPNNLVTGKNKQGQNTAFTIQLADSAPTSAAANEITIVV